jgi:putative transposase
MGNLPNNSINKDNYSNERMCKVLKVLISYYYSWYTGEILKHNFENIRLTQVIKQVFTESKKTYGSPRIAASLKRQG